MEKDIIIYMVSVVISIVIFYILAKKKCILVKRKKEELKIQKEISKNLKFLFYQILK